MKVIQVTVTDDHDGCIEIFSWLIHGGRDIRILRNPSPLVRELIEVIRQQ